MVERVGQGQSRVYLTHAVPTPMIGILNVCHALEEAKLQPPDRKHQALELRVQQQQHPQQSAQ